MCYKLIINKTFERSNPHHPGFTNEYSFNMDTMIKRVKTNVNNPYLESRHIDFPSHSTSLLLCPSGIRKSQRLGVLKTANEYLSSTNNKHLGLTKYKMTDKCVFHPLRIRV